MAGWYPLILLLHLACAIVFIGAVAFEVLVLEGLRDALGTELLQRVEQAVVARARRFMPWVVLVLFASGAALFDIRCGGFACMGTRFGWMLAAKVTLAFAVLAIFARVAWAGGRGLGGGVFRHNHRLLLALMAGIVVLAKLMFY
ncbi:hypothetical protein LY625_13170 [Lysobacter sp. GX 14042]|uniref:hypothetical protein n=1 Tax=Lysobacter sp. GX 14042 TaxID=2907155 RepID=UPI001F46B774|nr:hypothetical protein [Lysobacter sp. GX 14042]MCE7033553.1 hypothetical protein [Lysobacter sp. GX 14042]